MTLHYHGTPLSPTSELMKLAGKCFCVPFSDSRDADRCLAIGQSVMFDNGAFSAFTKESTGFAQGLEICRRLTITRFRPPPFLLIGLRRLMARQANGEPRKKSTKLSLSFVHR
jgi:hypothetical protein